MSGSFLTNISSPGTRKLIYALYSTVGLLLGGVQAGLGAVEAGSPDAQGRAGRLCLLRDRIGATAASNVVLRPAAASAADTP